MIVWHRFHRHMLKYLACMLKKNSRGWRMPVKSAGRATVWAFFDWATPGGAGRRCLLGRLPAEDLLTKAHIIAG